MKNILITISLFCFIFLSCKKDFQVVNPVEVRYQLYDSVLGNGPFVHVPINRMISFTYFPSTLDYRYQGSMLDKVGNADDLDYTYNFPPTDFGPSVWANFKNDTITIRYNYSSHTKMDVYGYKVQ